MYILIDANNVIIGTSTNLVATNYLNENNLSLFEIDNSEFKPEMLGSVLKYFEEVKK